MDSLKQKFFEKSSALAKEIKGLLKEHGDTVVGEVKLSQVYGGMRGLISMPWEPSALDAKEGIRFRGYSIPQLRELLPKAPGGKEPLPEGLFYLMLVGEIPTQEEVDAISQEWRDRADIPARHRGGKLTPRDGHPTARPRPERRFHRSYHIGFAARRAWCATLPSHDHRQ